jgi:hypothetical protein
VCDLFGFHKVWGLVFTVTRREYLIYLIYIKKKLYVFDIGSFSFFEQARYMIILNWAIRIIVIIVKKVKMETFFFNIQVWAKTAVVRFNLIFRIMF